PIHHLQRQCQELT
nr:immunoglobulin heavy chain junction region [Homo sapiens]